MLATLQPPTQRAGAHFPHGTRIRQRGWIAAAVQSAIGRRSIQAKARFSHSKRTVARRLSANRAREGHFVVKSASARRSVAS
jgi:hypothetical protein